MLIYKITGRLSPTAWGMIILGAGESIHAAKGMLLLNECIYYVQIQAAKPGLFWTVYLIVYDEAVLLDQPKVMKLVLAA